MRQILIVSAVMLSMAACNGNKDDKELKTDVVVLPTDTLYKNSMQSDTAVAVKVEEPPKKEVAAAPVKTPKKVTPKKVYSTTTPTPAPDPTPTQTTPVANEPEVVAAEPAPAPEKKGMSKSAKGAIIGGVGGAAAGAIISKKKGKGAIIGGVLGAAGGYIIGRKKDKKDAAADTTQ